jgi:Putative glycosyl/glycerophosphate transferases involved in teichoic acid biosynthesis TagF/TagB/EpsJ/RodC
MEKRGEQVLYLTAEQDDPLLNEQYLNIKAEFAGSGNKTFARMNMLKADVVLSSTPGLDVYQWKRSRDVKWYTHVFHAANDVTLYRMFGIDYYDALLLSGEYQIREIRELEALRHLPEKELLLAGLPHMDALRERLLCAAPVPEHETTVLLAPSWGPSGILSKYGSNIIERLLETGFHVIIRPHPQSFISENDMLSSLIRKYPESEHLQWDRSIDNFDVLHRSDILISDFSGVFFRLHPGVRQTDYLCGYFLRCRYV